MMTSDDQLDYRRGGLFKAISRGDLTKIELLFDEQPDSIIASLLSSRSNETLMLRRPSNAREYYVKNPTPIIMATAEWYTEILEFLASYKISLDQSSDVCDMSNTPSEYSDVPPLCLAAMTGKYRMVQGLVKNGASINQQTSIGDTALFEACFEGHLSIAQYLLQKGANIELSNKKKITPLMIASYANNFSIVCMLANLGANVNKKDEKGRNALFYCVPAGNLSTFQFLVENGCVVLPDTNGMTVLMEAAHHGHFEMVKYFVENSQELGIDINDFDCKGRNTLFYCAEGGHEEIFQYLITKATTIRPADDGSTVLMVAALKGHKEMVGYLIDNTENLGIDVNRKDNKGRNSLFYCISGGHIKLFDLLMRNGAWVESSDDGVTLLIQAAGKADADFGSYLLEQAEAIGLDIHATDKDGWNALFYCIASGNMSLFDMIHRKGVDPSTALDGRNILMQAVLKGDLEIVRHVLENAGMYKLDINDVDNEGRNALFYCIPGEHFEILKFLLERGVKPVQADSNTSLLMHAAEKGKSNFCSYLLAHAQEMKIDILQKDNEGLNVLNYAVRSGDENTLQMLMSRGAKIESTHSGTNVLMEAAFRGHANIVRYLLDHADGIGLDKYQRNSQGKNAIFFAAEGSKLETFQLLHENGIPLVPDANGRTVLMVAAGKDDDGLLYYILDNSKNVNIDLDACDNEGNSALNYAKCSKQTKSIVKLISAGISLHQSNILLDCLKQKDYDVINCLLASGVDLTKLVNSRDSFGLNSLHYCLQTQNPKLLETFGRYFNPLADADDEGMTLLMKASRQDNLDLMKYVVEDLTVDVDCKDKYGRNALMHTVEACLLTNMKYLLAFGAKFENDSNGRTPLMAAARSCDTSVLSHLLRFIFRQPGATLQKDSNGRTVVHYCAEGDDEENLKLLLAYKCDLDAEDSVGITALMVAASLGNQKMTKCLIDKGAFPNAKTKDGRNALHFCLQNESQTLPIVKQLVDSGCDPNQKDHNGYTPLMLSVGFDNIRQVRYLLEKGADPTIRNNAGSDAVALCPTDRPLVKILLGKYTAMDEKHQAILNRHVDSIKSEVKTALLLPYLLDQGIVTEHALADIEKEQAEPQRMDRLLGILKKKGPRAFDVLCNALQNNYERIAYELVSESQGGDEFYV